MRERTLRRGIPIAVVSAVLLVAVLASCGGPPEAGFARLELRNNTDTTITLVEMDGETIYNSSNGIAVGSSYEKVLEFVVSGTHTFTAKNGTDTLGTATESIIVNTSNYQAVSFGSSSSTDDAEYAEVTFTNDTTLTITQIGLWASDQNTSIATPMYTLSITDELPLMGMEPGDTVTDSLRNADGTYQVGIKSTDDWIMQSNSVTLSPDSPATYSIDEE